MAKKEYTFKYEDFKKKINEGVEPKFRFSEIDEIIDEHEEESIDDLDTSDQESLDADMEEIEQSIEENDKEEVSSPEDVEEEPELDMGNREDVSMDTLNQQMRNINDYMKILNNNLKLEDSSKMSKKMINEIEKINNILFG